MNQMSCVWVRNKISGYLDGELSEDERKAILHHMAQCPECDRELAEIRRLKNLLGTIQHATPQDDRSSTLPSVESLRSGVLVTRLREVVLIALATLGVLVVLLLLLPRYQATRDITTRFIEPYENLHRSVSGPQFEPVHSSNAFEITPVEYPVSSAEALPEDD